MVIFLNLNNGVSASKLMHGKEKMTFFFSFVSWYYVNQAENKMKNNLAFRIHLSVLQVF